VNPGIRASAGARVAIICAFALTLLVLATPSPAEAQAGTCTPGDPSWPACVVVDPCIINPTLCPTAPPACTPLTPKPTVRSGKTKVIPALCTGAPTSVAISSGPAHGTATASGLAITYEAPDDFTGTDSFQFTATNGFGTSTPVTQQIEVSATANEAPVCGFVMFPMPMYARVGSTRQFEQTCTDPDGDTLTFSKKTNPMQGTLGEIAQPQEPGGRVRVPYTPNAGAAVPAFDSFVLTANDGHGGTVDVPFMFSLVAATFNSPPFCSGLLGMPGMPLTMVAQYETASTAGTGCADPEGDPMTYAVSTAPTHGSLGFSTADNTLTYTPDAGYEGTDSFQYTASDGSLTSTPLVATVFVTPRSSLPVGFVTTRSGGTISSGALGGSHPIATSVTVPPGTAGGVVTIADSATITESAPSGYSFFGRQIAISAPKASGPDSPLRLTFDLLASELPTGTTAENLDVFRNGALVENCNGPAGHAVPAPCVAAREVLAGGNLRIVVLTVEASKWNFARGPDAPKQDAPADRGGGSGGGDSGGGDAPVRDTRAPAGSLKLASKQTLRTLLKKGLALTVKCDEACTTKVTLKIDRKTAKKLKLKTTVATATVKLTSAGSRKATVKLSAATKRKLKKARSLKLTVSARATDAAGNAKALRTTRLTLKR
jgi:hypothetical protein